MGGGGTGRCRRAHSRLGAAGGCATKWGIEKYGEDKRSMEKISMEKKRYGNGATKRTGWGAGKCQEAEWTGGIVHSGSGRGPSGGGSGGYIP